MSNYVHIFSVHFFDLATLQLPMPLETLMQFPTMSRASKEVNWSLHHNLFHEELNIQDRRTLNCHTFQPWTLKYGTWKMRKLFLSLELSLSLGLKRLNNYMWWVSTCEMWDVRKSLLWSHRWIDFWFFKEWTCPPHLVMHIK